MHFYCITFWYFTNKVITFIDYVFFNYDHLEEPSGREQHSTITTDSNQSRDQVHRDRKGRGEDETSGNRYPNYFSGSDFSTKVLSKQQHLLTLAYLLHVLTVVLVSNTFT